MAMKYLVLLADDGAQDVVIFPGALGHKAVAEAVALIRDKTFGNWRRVRRAPVSAGLVDAQWVCSGGSDELGLQAGAQDAEVMRGLKYLAMRDEDGAEGVFLFSKRIHHDAMAESLEGIEEGDGKEAYPVFREPVGAGFLEGNLTCCGRSETLGKGSRPEDSVLLGKQMS